MQKHQWVSMHRTEYLNDGYVKCQHPAIKWNCKGTLAAIFFKNLVFYSGG